MSVEIQVPRLAESISDAVLVEWLKEDGAVVRADEPVATLETDKAAVEIVADSAGTLAHLKQVGDVVKVGDVLGRIAESHAFLDTARDLYRQIKRPDESLEISSFTLAQKRLARIGTGGPGAGAPAATTTKSAR